MVQDLDIEDQLNESKRHSIRSASLAAKVPQTNALLANVAVAVTLQ